MTTLDKSTLILNINRDLADNATQEISPKDVRQNLLDIIDSVNNLTHSADITGTNFSTPETRNTRAGKNALSKLHLDGYISIDNTAYGYSANSNNYIGSGNTSIGSYSNSCNVYGSNNASLGYGSLGVNIAGDKNVAVGAYTLHGSKHGDYNIAIGHGAGYYIPSGEHYKFYVGAHNISGEAACDLELFGSGVPLLYGELDHLRLGVGVNELHDYGALQVSGTVSPNINDQFHLGHSLYKWKSVNEQVHFSGDYIGIGTESPSGTQGLVTVDGNIVPRKSNVYKLGAEDLKWDGFFNDIVVSGTAKINNYVYNEISSCSYHCRTLYLATSGICEDEPGVCGYLTDQEIEGGGFVIRSSGTDYFRDYEFTYMSPDSTLDCLESDTPYSRSSWNSNISIHIASGSHLMTDRVIGNNESLALVTTSGCNGLVIENLQDSVSNNRFTYGIGHVRSFAASDSYLGGLSSVNFLGSGNNNFLSSHILAGSGAEVGSRLLARLNTGSGCGFHASYLDQSDQLSSGMLVEQSPYVSVPDYAGNTNTFLGTTQKKDRYEIKSVNTSGEFFNSFTIMRDPVITIDSGRNDYNYNRWNVNPEGGLVGISNYSTEKLPDSLVNIQSTGDFSIKATAPDGFRPRLELLSGPNDRNHWITSGVETNGVRDGASYGGLVMEFLPSGGRRDYWSNYNPTEAGSTRLYRRRHAIIGLVTGDTFGGYNDGSKTGAYWDGYDDSQNIATRFPEPDYFYRSYIAFSESGVGVNTRTPHSALTVHGDVGKDEEARGGIISMKVQDAGTGPRTSKDWGITDFGDLIASGYTYEQQELYGQASTIWYVDASGNSFELINNPNNPQNTSSFVADASGNTYLGYNAPASRTWLGNGHLRHNTAYGMESLMWGQYTQFNTAIGSKALRDLGSGISMGSGNVAVGHLAGLNLQNAVNSIIIGNETKSHDQSNSITIGHNITSGNHVPHSHMFLLGAGDDNILLYGKMGPNAADRELQVPKGSFLVGSTAGSDKIKIYHDQNFFGTDKVASVLRKEDTSSAFPDGGVAFTFKGTNNEENTLVTMRHAHPFMSTTSSFVDRSRPVVGVSGDVNVLGAINFSDGSSLSGVLGISLAAGSGISTRVEDGVSNLDLDIEELNLAENYHPLSTQNSFIPLSTNNSVGKVSVGQLASFIELSGTQRVLPCNIHVFSETTKVDTDTDCFSNFLGYRAGSGVIFSQYATFLGPEAGSNSSTGISGVDSSVFIGHRAGYDAEAADNSVFIGTDAGKDAEDSRMSVFIGHSAGKDAKSKYSIGIGDNALENASGLYNLEITTKQSQRMISNEQYYKFNIGQTLAGSFQSQKLSVGDATLLPSSVLHVNYSSTLHATTDTPQEWHVDGIKVASVNKFGAFDNIIEGQLTGNLSAPADSANPTSGELIIYDAGFADGAYYWNSGERIWIHNRDSSLSGNTGAYCMVAKIGYEYRPIWMGCQGM
tara:strand:- start:1597 stop:5985 length:4389 start_codon:yes stop_codon:yes gene_type:complete